MRRLGNPSTQLEVDKLELVACLGTAHKLRMDFTFLKCWDKKKSKEEEYENRSYLVH